MNLMAISFRTRNFIPSRLESRRRTGILKVTDDDDGVGVGVDGVERATRSNRRAD